MASLLLKALQSIGDFPITIDGKALDPKVALRALALGVIGQNHAREGEAVATAGLPVRIGGLLDKHVRGQSGDGLLGQVARMAWADAIQAVLLAPDHERSAFLTAGDTPQPPPEPTARPAPLVLSEGAPFDILL
jgi:hypothetical protein